MQKSILFELQQQATPDANFTQSIAKHSADGGAESTSTWTPK